MSGFKASLKIAGFFFVFETDRSETFYYLLKTLLLFQRLKLCSACKAREYLGCSCALFLCSSINFVSFEATCADKAGAWGAGTSGS